MSKKKAPQPKLIDVGAAIAPEHTLCEAMREYVASDFFTSIRQIENLKHAYAIPKPEILGGGYQPSSGIHTRISEKFYPQYNYKRSKQAIIRDEFEQGSAARGSQVDREIAAYIANGFRHTSVPLPETLGAISYFENDLKHTLQGAQVPARIDCMTAVTQADCITRDADGKLYMWEIKACSRTPRNTTPQNPRQKKFACAPLKDISNSRANQWRIQCYLTQQGLRSVGLPIAESYVLCLSRRKRPPSQRGEIYVTKISLPKWTTRLDSLEFETPPLRERDADRARRVKRQRIE